MIRMYPERRQTVICLGCLLILMRFVDTYSSIHIFSVTRVEDNVCLNSSGAPQDYFVIILFYKFADCVLPGLHHRYTVSSILLEGV